ncbi:hypothetical protein BDQ17DRAFT_1356199 [Cyathus striatus]|nr:hypothetical protein BDQ17DRAFT_1356199 [Cyathus striatus]
MVSSSISSTTKILPLSYAELAKKAQSISSPIAVAVKPRSTAATTASTTVTAASPASNSTASTISSTKASDTSSPSSVTLPTQPPSPAASISAHVSDSAATETKLFNGHPKAMTSTITTTQQSSNDLAVKALSIVAAHPSTQKSTSPLVNIWDKRRMAAVRSAAAPENPPLSSSKPSVLSPSLSSSDNLLSAPHGLVSAKQKNGITPNTPLYANEDPFTVRMPFKQTHTPPVTIPPTDSEHWPEVGKAVPQPRASINGVPSAEQERTAEHTPSITTNTNKKGEKKKWVPLPLEAPDAHNRSSRSHSRKGAQQSNRNMNMTNNTNKSNHNTNNNANIDGQPSGSRQQQQHNKDRSGRNSNSHSATQSASQSRVQSRTASAASSPRLPRGRRLPDDAPITGTSGYALPPPHTAHNSVQPLTSNTNSPSQVHVSLPPTSTDSSVYPVPIDGPLPSNTSTYYSPQLYPHPRHYIHGSHSPGYPTSGSPPIPVYPPYHMYTYYDYGASSSTTPPHPNWNHSHPGSGHQTPTYFPHGHAHYPTAPVPSTTSTAVPTNGASPHVSSSPSDSYAASRPPLPSEQSEAVAGYRPVLDADGSKQPVSFGSIDIPGASQCPSPAPPRPEEYDLEKVFSAFAIGVEPEEAGSTRLSASKAMEEAKDKAEGTKWEFGTAGSVDETGSIFAGALNGVSNGNSGMNGGSRKGDDDFEVKDFGFGFGGRDAAQESEKERNDQTPREKWSFTSPTSGQPRRGYGFDRGGFGGRRARGMNGYWRGNGRYNRGGGGYRQQHLPYNAAQPPHFPPMVSIPDPMTGYLPPPRQQRANYMAGFEPYQPPVPPTPPVSLPSQSNGAPVPTPVTTIPFPLDPTRWYLLGQLEYYLSPQNMAQDFYLRKQMDSRGWIPIPLIASFNRIKRLTADVQLVRDVLTLSSIVQVREDNVRMGGWERYVLPDAPKSAVDEYAVVSPIYTVPPQLLQNIASGQQERPQLQSEESIPSSHSPLVNGVHVSEAHYHPDGDDFVDSEEDGESEDEVEFVLGEDAGGWSTEQSR